MKVELELPDAWLLSVAGLNGCLDKGCLIRKPMVGTNGGCRCYHGVQEAFGCTRDEAQGIVNLIAAVRRAIDEEGEYPRLT